MGRDSDSHISCLYPDRNAQNKDERPQAVSRKPKPEQEADAKEFRINTKGRKQTIMIKAHTEMIYSPVGISYLFW